MEKTEIKELKRLVDEMDIDTESALFAILGKHNVVYYCAGDSCSVVELEKWFYKHILRRQKSLGGGAE